MLLKATSAAGDMMNNSSGVVFNADAITNNGFAGGTFQYQAFSAGSSETLGILTTTAGAGAVKITPTGGINNLTFGSMTAPSQGTSLNLVAPASPGTNTITLLAGTVGFQNAHAYYNGGDFAYSPAATSSTLRAPNYGTDAGFATVNTMPVAATVAAANHVLYNASGSTTGAAAQFALSAKLSGAASTLSLLAGQTLTIQSAANGPGGIIATNGGTAFADIISGGVGLTSGGTGDLVFRVDGSATDTLMLSTPMTATTTGGFTKNGAGVLILNAVNLETAAGTITVNEGKLQLLGATTTLGATNMNVTLRQGTFLDVNGVNVSAAPVVSGTATLPLNAVVGAGTITNGAASGTATIAIGSGNTAGTFTGVIQDGATASLALTKLGTATESLTGLNTFTGVLTFTGTATSTLAATTLANIGLPSSIGAGGLGGGTGASVAQNQGSIVFASGANTILYTGASAAVFQATQTPSVAINRLFTIAGGATGTIDSSGQFGNNTAAASAANNAALVFNNTNPIAYTGSGAAVLGLTGTSTGDNEFDPQLSNANFAVTKSNSGLWILGNPNNNYGGATTITQGILRAQDANSNAISGTVSAAATATTDLAVLSANGLSIGQAVTGTGIAGGTTVAAILDSSHIRLSQNATVASGAALTYGSINSLSANSNLVFNQTVAGTEAELEMTGTFTRSIGAGAGQVQWGASGMGGFAASNAPLIVNFGGANAPVSFGTGAGFIGNGTGQLYLNSTTALSDVTVTNPINLNGGARTVNVFDNTTTNTDYATISGVISGGVGSSLTKAGNGLLYLTGANTYSGNTTILIGSVVVTSIGGGSIAASAFGDGSGTLTLNTAGELLYAGPGETAQRQILLSGASNIIEASGSGALILNNVVNATSGNKTLTLTGLSNDANEIKSVLADNGGTLTVTKSLDSGTWILSGANTYTGGTNINSGLLGIGGATTGTPGTALGTGTVTLGQAAIFATNPGGLTINNPINFTSNLIGTFTGANAITLAGNLNNATGAASNLTLSNMIASPAVLTISGNLNNADATVGRTLIIQGTGNTLFSGNLISTGGQAVGIGINVGGTFTFSGSLADGPLHTSSTFTQGTVILSKAGNLNPLGSNSVILFLGGTLQSSSSALTTGANAIVNALRLDNTYGIISGTGSIEFSGNAAQGSFNENNAGRVLINNLSGGATLTFSTNVANLSNGTTGSTWTLGGTGTTNVNVPIVNGTQGPAVTGAFTFSGSGAVNLTGISTFIGLTTLNGGVTTLSTAGGQLTGTTGIVVNNGATLALDNFNNSGVNASANRFAAKPVTLNGGILNLIGFGTGTTETGGNLALGSGQSVISVTNNGGNTVLNFGTFTGNAGSGINFTSNATLGTATNQILFSTAPTLSPATIGVLARGTINGADFAAYNTDGLTANALGVQAFNAYNVPTLSSVTVAGTNTTVTVANTAGLTPGQAVFGPTVSVGATVGTILSSTTYTIAGTITTGGTQSLTYGTAAYTNINSALIPASTDTIKVGTGGIPALGNADDLNFSRSFNAINIVGTGINLSSTADNATLTINSGGVIVSGGANTLSVGRIALGAEGAFHINPGASLDVTGSMTGASGLTKNLGGLLSLTAQQFYLGATVLNGGTTRLAFGTNTLFPGQALTVNSGATLDLNGKAQYVGAFTSSNQAVGGTGGTVTNSAAGTATLVTTSTSAVFTGSITGAIDFARVGPNTLTFGAAQAYTGSTSLLGGILVLRDNATLANTSAITINGATLQLSNNTGLFIDNSNRVNDAAPISMSGGTIDFQGRPDALSSEVLGALTSLQGANVINSTVNVLGNYQSADLTFASLTRSNSSTINFTGTTLGSAGNSARIFFTSPLVNNATTGALGAWAIVNSTDYAGYNAAQGVGAIGTAGYLGYKGTFGPGNLTNLLAPGAALTTTLSANTTTGMLRLGGAFTNSIAFAAGTEILTLEQGGLLRSADNQTTNIGTATQRGVLTAGLGGGVTTDLLVFNNANLTGATAMTINSIIADNAAGSTNTVRLVKSGGNAATTGVLALTAVNTYTGGTVVDQGTLELRGTNTGDVVIPSTGGLTINGGIIGSTIITTVQMFATAGTNPTGQGQIGSGTDVTLNGRSALTLIGNNTLNSLTFNNNGGEVGPVVSPVGILTLTNGVTASSNDASVAARITAGTLSLAAGAHLFAIDSIKLPGSSTIYNTIAPTLTVSSLITGAGSITKSGDGLAQFTGANTFTGGLTTTGTVGGIMLGASTNIATLVSPGLGVNTTAFINGPVGTGTLTIAPGNSLVASSNSPTLVNSVVFQGNVIFDDNRTGTADTITLAGPVAFASGALTLSIPNPTVTATITGPTTYTGVTSLTKTGLGNLNLNLTGIGSAVPLTFSGGGTLSLLTDGDGTGAANTVNLGAITFDTSLPVVTIGRAGQTVLFNQAQNKTIAPSSFLSHGLGNGLNLTNNQGYGLLLVDNIALNTNLGLAGAVYTVSAASTSNAVQGLTLNGAISGGTTGAGNVVLTKAGAGTLVLGGTNTFGGSNSIIDITGGTLQIASNSALGDASNVVRLSAATQGLRAAGTFTATGRVINLGITGAGIDVTGGNTLTLDTAFAPAASANTFTKADNGILAFASGVNNSTLTGAWTISAGAIQISGATNLNASASTVTVSNVVGAALQLTNGVTLTKGAAALSLSNSGINSGGALESVGAFTNVVASNVTLTNDATIGSDTGSVLTLSGGITGAKNLTFSGGGAINLTTTALGAVSTVTKIGSGTTTLGVASTGFIGALTVNAGAFTIAGTGAQLGITGAITVNPGGTFNIDDSGTALANRASGRALNLNNGTFNYTVNSGGASAETVGALAIASGLSTVNVNPGSPVQNSTLTFASLTNFVTTFNGSALNFTGTFGTANNKILFTAAPAMSNNVIPRTAVNGTDFASYNSDGVTGNANGIQAFTAYSALGSLESAALLTPTATFKATSSQTLTTNRTINALNLSGGVTVSSLLSGGTLTLTSDSLLSSTGANTIAAGVVLPFAATEGWFNVASGSSLNLLGTFTGSHNITKAGGGTLTISAQTFDTTAANFLTINGGTVVLGGSNLLLPNIGLGAQVGGTLDLNGNAQTFGLGNSTGSLTSFNGTVAGSGGTVSSSSGTGTLVAVAGSAVSYGGTIDKSLGGDVFFNKAGTNVLTLLNASNYSGGTMITGGGLTLKDAGALTGGAPIALQYGTLTIDNTGTLDSPNRINDNTDLNLRGGSIAYLGRAQTASSETFRALNVLQGSSNLNITVGGTGVNSVDLTFASLNPTAGATINFQSLLTMGLIGSGNGRVKFTSAPTLVNGIIPYAFGAAGELVSYTSNLGIGRLGGVGYAGYDFASSTGLALPASGGTQNISLSGNFSYTVPDVAGVGTAGTYQLNAIAITAAAAGNSLNFADTLDTVNLTAGVLMRNANFTGSVGNSAGFGKLTAGGSLTNPNLTGISDLLLYNNTGASAWTINSNIVDNALSGDAVRLVYSAYNASNAVLAGTNTYTGGTFVNGGAAFTGTLTLSTAGANATTVVSIPGNLTISSATVTATVAGAIKNTAAVTMNGGSTLTLTGANTLASLTFNSNGGAAPTVSPTGTLTLTGGIASNPSNVGSVAIVNAGTLDLNANGSFSVAVDSTRVNGVDVAPWQAGLTIGSLIQNGGLSKSGPGVLNLSLGTSTFAGGVNVTTGGLMLSASSTPSTVGSVVTSGPLGTGTLTLADSTLLLTSAANTVANAVTVGGGFTFGGTTALTLNGTMSLAAVSSINTVSPGVVLTVGGLVSGGATSLTKTGLGTLTFSNAAVANTYTGVTIVNGGTLSISGNNSLGADPGSFVANQLTIANGAILAATNTLILAPNRGVTIGAGGAVFSPATSLRLDGRITSASSQPITMIGAGTLIVNANNSGTFTGVWNANAGTLTGVGPNSLAGQAVSLNGGVLSLLWDGTSVDAGGTPETAVYGDALTMNTAAATINVDRALISFAPFSQSAGNKTMQVGSLTITQPGSTLSVTNGNGNGLAVSGAVSLPTTGVTTLSVGTATATNAIPGLTIQGVISGGNTGAANVVLAKTGAGTLLLTNPGSTFGGSNAIIDVTAGELQVTSNGALGDATNVVRLSANSAVTGLRLAGGTTYTLTGRTIKLNAATVGIDATTGTAATLDTPFTLSATTNSLQKNDNGTLIFGTGANNSTWNSGVNLVNSTTTNASATVTVSSTAALVAGMPVNGPGIVLGTTIASITNGTTLVLSANAGATSATASLVFGGLAINAGAVRISGSSNLGTTLVSVAPAVQAALQISGGITVANGLFINNSGINTAGAIENVSGSNVISSPITLISASAIGADPGSTLSISGGFVGAQALTLNTIDTGAINFTGAIGTAAVPTGITKIGNGSVIISAASSAYTGTLAVSAGNLTINSAGILGGTGAVTVNEGATLAIDNSGTATTSRLGGRALTLAGALLDYTNNSGGASTETIGALTLSSGGSTINIRNPGSAKRHPDLRVADPDGRRQYAELHWRVRHGDEQNHLYGRADAGARGDGNPGARDGQRRGLRNLWSERHRGL